MLTAVVEVLVAGNVVADIVVSLPAAKQRKSRPQLKLNAVVRLMKMTGRDVTNLIAVVHILRRRRQQSLKNSMRNESTTI